MLAKEIKMASLKKQREFIKEQLCARLSRNDGNTCYSYIGDLYPEVIEYFKEEGFIVNDIKSDLLTEKYNGVPVYLFRVAYVELTESELAEAENYKSRIFC